MVTMLWRAVGQPAAGGTANFTDVSADAYYAGAVSWAVENGITTGVGGGRFDPTGRLHESADRRVPGTAVHGKVRSRPLIKSLPGSK